MDLLCFLACSQKFPLPFHKYKIDMALDKDNIFRFWQWFVKSESIIKDCIENENSEQQEYVVEQMNEFILSFGVLTWDIGLNDDDCWFLTISPNGNKDMLEVSRQIMDEAPEHMDWLFYASRPEKNWNRQFTVLDSYMNEQFIDASQWYYLLFDSDDGKLELIIEAQNIPQLDPELAETAAEQFVIQEIGEEARIELISAIIILQTLKIEYQESKTLITELREHLGEL
jgi:hypothetical protein